MTAIDGCIPEKGKLDLTSVRDKKGRLGVGCGVWGVGGDRECLESIRASGVRGYSTDDSNPHQYARLSSILNPN